MELHDVEALEAAVEKLAAERSEVSELTWWRRFTSVSTGGAIAALGGLALYNALWSMAAAEAGSAITLVGLMVVLARRVLLDEADQQIRRHRDAAETCYLVAARCLEE